MNELGIHSYVWLPTWTTAGGRIAVERAAKAGFDRVVVPLRDPDAIEAAAVRRLFEDRGLRPVNTANQLPDADVSSMDRAVRRRGVERHLRSLHLAKEMGSDQMSGVLYGVLGKAARAANADNLAAAAESLATVAAKARQLGIRLTLEIVNRYESNLINTVAQALELRRMIGADNVFLHLDTFHMNIEEADPLAALDAALPYLRYFELDQNDRGMPDRGAIDFMPMLARLREAGYDGMIGVEAFSSAIASPEVAAGVAAWRDLFNDGDLVAKAAIGVITQAGIRSRRLGERKSG
jgi:D-psicose/D-tagatose/L-ribulose 3-epimerase